MAVWQIGANPNTLCLGIHAERTTPLDKGLISTLFLLLDFDIIYAISKHNIDKFIS